MIGEYNFMDGVRSRQRLRVVRVRRWVLAAMLLFPWGTITMMFLGAHCASGKDGGHSSRPATAYEEIAEERILWRAQRVEDYVAQHRDEGATLAATRACNAFNIDRVHVGTVVKICRPGVDL